MHLASAFCDPQLIKEEILQYYKDLVAPIKNDHNFFFFHSLETKNFSITSEN